MRFLPHLVKQNALWHVVKFIVIITLFIIIFGGSLLFNWMKEYYGKPNGRIIHFASTTNNKDITVNNNFFNNMSKLMDGGGEDEDGNSNICHKIGSYKLDQCTYAIENCPNPMSGGILNYMTIKYCGFKETPVMFYILGVFWLLFLFYLLSNTAEANFCPSLTQISNLLRLSPDIAGVTFLAFGNGAPDIASIVSGIFSGSAGFGLGEPIGSGLFICSIIMAVISLISKDAKMSAFPFIRDVVAYLISVIFVVTIILVWGEITLWQSLTFFALYIIYVLIVIGYRLGVVVYNKRKDKKEKKKEKKKRKAEKKAIKEILKAAKKEFKEDKSEEKSSLLPINSEYYTSDMKKGSLNDLSPTDTNFIKSDASSTSTEDSKSPYDEMPQDNDETTFLPRFGFISRSLSGKLIVDHFYDKETKGLTDVIEEDYEYKGVKGRIKYAFDYFLDWIEWKEKSTFDKIFYFFEAPTILARNLTIPKADPEDWSKFFAVVSPLFMPIFGFFAIGKFSLTIPGTNLPWWALITILGAVFSLFILFTSKTKKPPRYHLIFVGLSFIMSILWIFVVANELVDFLDALGVMWQISDAVMSIILAAGNSFGDLAADVVVAKSGLVEMAVAAIYSSPNLNLLLGLGISTLAQNLITGKSFKIETSVTLMVSFVFIFVILLSSIVVIPAAKFHSPKIFGVFLSIIYICYIVVAILTESKVLFSNST